MDLKDYFCVLMFRIVGVQGEASLWETDGVLPLWGGKHRLHGKMSCASRTRGVGPHLRVHLHALIPVCGPGRLHAVHQHCGALSGGHELQSPSPVWVHKAGTGWLPRGEVMRLWLQVVLQSALQGVTNADSRSPPPVRNVNIRRATSCRCRSRHTWITCLTWVVCWKMQRRRMRPWKRWRNWRSTCPM